MSTIIRPLAADKSSAQAEFKEVLMLSQEATSTYIVMGYRMLQTTTTVVNPGDDWDRYFEFEANRKGVSAAEVRHEEDLARAELDGIHLDEVKIRKAARVPAPNHPYLVGDDEPCPFD